ncbi:MAG: ABC transporter substrate-binding protein [Cellulosilyticaceae bacterium]
MKKLWKKILTVSLGVCLLSGVFAGCAPKTSDKPTTDKTATSGPVTIDFWTISLRPTFDDYFLGMFKEYESMNPNVKINWVDLPGDAIQNKLLASISSGNAPDVVNINSIMASTMSSKGALVNMDDYLTQEQKDVYFDGMYRVTQTPKGTWALPWYTNAPVLFMNKSIVEQAGLDPTTYPKTEAELFEWSKQISEKTGKTGTFYTLGIRTLSERNITILNEDNTAAAFNNQATRDLINEIKELMANGYIPKQKTDFEILSQLYASNNLAMITEGTSFITKFKDAAPDVYANTLVYPAPTSPNNSVFTFTQTLAVPASSDTIEQSVDFAAFITNATNQLEFCKNAAILPSSKASVEDEFFKQNDGTIESAAKMASVGTLAYATDFTLPVDNFGPISELIDKGFESIMYTDADVDATLKQMEDEVNALLKQ